MWISDISESGGPKYLAIADRLTDAVAAGHLKSGERLPPQRELAWKLGVTLGTVSRAYREAERRGLVGGEVGRGTYVRGAEEAGMGRFGYEKASIYSGHGRIDEAGAGPIDLKLIVPAAPGPGDELRAALRAVAAMDDISDLMNYGPESGLMRHREAAAKWLGRTGLTADPGDLFLTNGAMHAVLLAAGALARPGDTVAAEALTYPGFRYLAEQRQLRVRPLAMDEQGVIPEAFEAACQAERLAFFYTVPTMQNPTASVLPADRRTAIAEIARRYQVPVVEDDVYGFLPPDRPPPISELLPDLGFYCSGGAKNLAAGLRIGFLRAPDAWREGVLAGMRISTWMASTLGLEVAARWIEDGTADRLTHWHREQAATRQALARSVLGDFEYTSHPYSYHLWLSLPAPLRSHDVTVEAERRGVLVTGAEHFVGDRGAVPHAVRVCLAAEADPVRLRRGLETVADILRRPHGAKEGII